MKLKTLALFALIVMLIWACRKDLGLSTSVESSSVPNFWDYRVGVPARANLPDIEKERPLLLRTMAVLKNMQKAKAFERYVSALGYVSWARAAEFTQQQKIENGIVTKPQTEVVLVPIINDDEKSVMGLLVMTYRGKAYQYTAVTRGKNPLAVGKNKGKNILTQEGWDVLFTVLDKLVYDKEPPQNKLETGDKTQTWHYLPSDYRICWNTWIEDADDDPWNTLGTLVAQCTQAWDWEWIDDDIDNGEDGDEGRDDDWTYGNPALGVFDCNDVEDGTAVMGPCGCYGGNTGIPSCSTVMPCEQKNILYNSQKFATNYAATNAIKAGAYQYGNWYEWGYEQRLVNLTGQTYHAPNPRNGQMVCCFPYTFTWNSYYGYMTGIVHTHLLPHGASSGDIRSLYNNINHSELVNAGTEQQNIYKQNAKAIVTTPNFHYAVMITDWTSMESLYNNNTESAHESAWNAAYANYLSYHPDETEDAGVYALKQVFGSAIQVYRADLGSPEIFDPMNVVSGDVVKENCN